MPRHRTPLQNGDAANKVYLPLITGTNGGTQSINLEQLALELVAAHHTLVIDELAINHWSSTDYSSQGVIAFTFTVMDNHDGMSYDVTLDKDGQD